MSNGPYNAVAYRIELALAALMAGSIDFTQPALAALAIQTGVDDDTVKLPVVICAGLDESEEIYGTQIKRVAAFVQVQSYKADGADAHRYRVGCVEDALFNGDIQSGNYPALSAAITAAGYQIHVHAVVPGRSSTTIRDDCWIWSQPLEIITEWFSTEDSSSSSSSSFSSLSSLSTQSSSSSSLSSSSTL